MPSKTSTATARTIARELGRSPDEPGTARLARDLEDAVTESKHTPGPWHILCRSSSANGTDHRMSIAGASRPGSFGGQVATAHGQDLSESEVEANASLIAAAPDLLEACRAAVYGANHIDCVRAMQEVLPCIRAALAKAEGGAR